MWSESGEKLFLAGFRTHPGLVRDSNEDSLFVDENLGLFIVADGMGGHNAGEVASAMAVRSLPIHIMNGVQRGRDAFVVLKEALIYVDHAILDISEASPSWDNMGTTAVVALVSEETAIVAHVGDSRCYLVTQNDMRQLTEDHSFVAQWVAQGTISPEEARRHPARHGIFMALGVGDELQPGISAWPFKPGDRILLCSDGLTDMLWDNEIENTIRLASSVQFACDTLVDQALARGGVDNVTVVIVENRS